MAEPLRVESAELREEDIVGRRRAWFWRFWFRAALMVVVAITITWIFVGGTWWGAAGEIRDGITTVLSSPQLWIQAVFPARRRLAAALEAAPVEARFCRLTKRRTASR